jgi:putative ABC transport system permease protein
MPLSDLPIITRIAVSDYLHEGRFSFCLIVSLAAILTPLLVLFGLKYGIISTMTDELSTDPRSRELRPLMQREYYPSFFEHLGQRSDIGFLIPKTRFLSATIRLRNERLGGGEPLRAELTPSAEGDPLLAGISAKPDGFETIILSAPAAEELQVGEGDEIEGLIHRSTENSEHRLVRLRLRVAAVLPAARSGRPEALVSLPFLVAAEDYREGRAVPEFGADGRAGQLGERSFASFRLYARSIDNVAGLREFLADQGIQSDTRLDQIELVQRLDHRLTSLFVIITVLAGTGFVLSLTVNLWSSTDRKRRELSILRLIGFKAIALACIPGIQALLTAMLGSAVAAGLSLVTERFINGLFGEALQAQQVLSRLEVKHFLVAAGITLVLAIFASMGAGFRAASLSPSEGLRDE